MNLRYTRALRLIHWVTAGLVLLQVALAVMNVLLYEPRPILAEALVQAHISLGALVFAVTLARIVVRFRSRTLPSSTNPVLRAGAVTVHFVLYALLLALPITGYLKLAALGFSVNLIGIIQLPPMALNISLAQYADLAHDVLAFGLGGVLILHVSAAILHVWFDGGRTIDARNCRPDGKMGSPSRT